MILLHEQMPKEATHLKQIIEQVFNIPVRLLADNLDRFFVPLPNWKGFWYLPRKELVSREFPGTAVLFLTQRDLYGGIQSQDDEWALGAAPYDDYYAVVATARLMGINNAPRSSLNIDTDLYLRRLSLLTIHELGHNLVKARHHQEAAWVNARTGFSMALGPHCDDHSCAMYEVVDITAPPKDEGYLRLGNACFYDAGLDEQLQRLRPDWFCSRCWNHIVIIGDYRNVDIPRDLV